ncbi:aldo/keto reductase [Synechococcus sp. BA-124 BA4]|uniref:aldo/keto reductase n=1 Tax=unclassified Synechococcus TaxID=2626047 RepID=UPI002AD582AB|nr:MULTISPECIES: aldo/keto reductase [unclassified Synechococcus]MEA5400557.1 aldo/keto reductase [Synechococcus sp. BA-124 BA4]
MPVLSLGGMRFQQSWSDLPAGEITAASQANLRATLEKAVTSGFHHIETARHYGTSERQLGDLLREVPDPRRILQTKVPPHEDPAQFEAELELSFDRLRIERLDLLAIHGLNLPAHLEQTLRPGGCLDVARRWQQQGRIGHVGFSTHAPLPLILEAIASDAFDYINLHWYYIRQDNRPALEAARRHDMGVFVISPTDKGGHLHTPSERINRLCAPLHPIEFNDLFCLREAAIHTISVGAAGPADLDLHLQAVARLNEAECWLAPVQERLERTRLETLGARWLESWSDGLPSWEDTPGGLNLPVLLWLHNLLEAWDLEGYARARYGLLGQGSHWFPGANAEALDREVSEADLLAVLTASPWAERIPTLLRSLRERLGGTSVRRLMADA